MLTEEKRVAMALAKHTCAGVLEAMLANKVGVLLRQPTFASYKAELVGSAVQRAAAS